MDVFIDDNNKPLKIIFEILKKQTTNVALVINDISYSYKNLYNEVEKFCKIIEELTLQNSVIAISADLSFEMHACMLAVIKSGNTILPFNITYPIERLKNNFENVSVSLVFLDSNSENANTLFNECPHICFYCFQKNIFIKEIKKIERNEYVNNFVYILFTSGTTGKPKAVPILAENLNYLLYYFLDKTRYDFNENDRFLQVYEPTFDVFYFSFLLPLCVEATCYVMHSNSNLPKYMQIIDALKKNDITVVSMVPTLLLYMQRFFGELEFPTLRYSFFSGDALLNTVAKKWQKCLPYGVIHNFYGPTETTIVCTRYIYNELNANNDSFNNIVPLGTSFPWMNFLIVNEFNESILQGEIGELCFSGKQAIENYINDISEYSFFHILNSNAISSKYYKTGDLAFVNDKGDLIFCGRKDFQIKINGYRVDLLEVEEAIYKITNTALASIVKNNMQGLLEIYVFIEGENFIVGDIFKKISNVLPSYLIPNRIILLKKLPTNSNDKIDKLALQNIKV